jgi:hypothetical protein
VLRLGRLRLFQPRADMQEGPCQLGDEKGQLLPHRLCWRDAPASGGGGCIPLVVYKYWYCVVCLLAGIMTSPERSFRIELGGRYSRFINKRFGAQDGRGYLLRDA